VRLVNRSVLGAVGAGLFVASLAAQGPAGPFDLVVANGRVMDPESNTDAVRHVGITGGVIRAISAAPLQGRSSIDATGLVVAPGFIDLHQHGHTPADYRRKAADGVTAALELEVGTADIDQWYGPRAGTAAIHYGVSVGHIPVRMAVMNDPGNFLPSGPAASREATEEEIVQIKAGLGRGLARGAVGVGFGIAYTPGATRWEIAEMFEIAGAAGAPAYVHMRGGDVVAAFEEVLALAVASGAPLHVVHAQSSGGRQTPLLLRLLGRARGRGIDVTTEMYPYTASQTRIESALYDGWEKYPDERFQSLLWPATGERLTRETFEKYRKQGGSVISFGNTEEVVRGAIADPLTMVASDGSATHPRGTGTFARVLGRYVREQNALTLMTALRKMSLMPAERLAARVPAARNKGRIRPGADADLTMFDPATVVDEATYEAPTRPSRGIVHVLVGGTPVVRGGTIVESAAPGRPLRAAVADRPPAAAEPRR
jgi:N-acyl-D-aspartate/D-glutamate deacylase